MNRGDNVTTQTLSVPYSTWVRHGVLFSLLWILLTQADAGSLALGVPVVALATWCAIRLFQDQHHSDQVTRGPHLLATLRFIPFFLEQSLKGGWESALFAVDPRRKVNSGFIHYDTVLPPGRPRLFFVNTISLLPGTVSAACDGDSVTIHALDVAADNREALQRCERRIAALFGIEFASPDEVSLTNEHREVEI